MMTFVFEIGNLGRSTNNAGAAKPPFGPMELTKLNAIRVTLCYDSNRIAESWFAILRRTKYTFRGVSSLAGLIDYSQLIPVFPLPNVVLFPKAVVPLHIFEPRYRSMVVDALRGNRLIAIALLQDGFETKYNTLEAPIHPIVCVGSVLKSEELCGGRYNLLLRGIDRARVIHEDVEKCYRRAALAPIAPVETAGDITRELFSTLRTLVHSESLSAVADAANWKTIFECGNVPLSDVADLLAFSIFERCCDKQRFLSEPCVRKRACQLIKMLQAIGARLEHRNESRRQQGWPPPCCDN